MFNQPRIIRQLVKQRAKVPNMNRLNAKLGWIALDNIPTKLAFAPPERLREASMAIVNGLEFFKQTISNLLNKLFR